MAESQAPYLYDNTADALISSLSSTRFRPYLVSAGHNIDFAFALYLYNARIAKAFLYPLHILEITLRNRISDIFCDLFNENWCHDTAFRQILTEESRNTLDRGISRAKSNAAPDIVATLTFDFWSNLFREEYDRSLWQTKMHHLLPNASKKRSEFQRNVKRINHFRNRIAHHEPIYKMDLSKYHAELSDMICWLSKEASAWVKHFSTVNQCLRTRPSTHSTNGKSILDLADSDFCCIRLKDNISNIPTKRFWICENEEGKFIAVIEAQHLAHYLISLREGEDLMIDLKKHSFADVVKHISVNGNLITCEPSENIYHATAGLKGKKQYLIAVGSDGPVGIVAKAHRKY